MYLTDDTITVSSYDILIAIFVLTVGPIILKALSRKVADIADVYNKSDDYPGPAKSPDIFEEDDGGYDLDTERREKVIFEEKISNVIFRYDEKTRVLTIGEEQTSMPPIKMKLNSFSDFREFVDRLEEYIDE